MGRASGFPGEQISLRGTLLSLGGASAPRTRSRSRRRPPGDDPERIGIREALAFGKALYDIRTALGLTVAELAMRAAMTESVVFGAPLVRSRSPGAWAYPLIDI
jgi:hypothetical protein